MNCLKSALLFCAISSLSIAVAETPATERSQSKSENPPPVSMSTRFFDLGGIINQLFPGFNQGNQGAPGRNPLGMDFPANSQFYPARPIQNQNPQIPATSGGSWPVLDDASQYPNQGAGSQQSYPDQSYGGMYPQQGNPMYPNQGGFQNPMQQIFGGMLNPQYPQENPSQYPQENPSQYPQYPGQDYKYPSQGNIGGQNPSNTGTDQIQYPGTAAGLGGGRGLPPQEGTWNGDQPNDFNNGSPNMPADQMPYPGDISGPNNAILGSPVSVPPTTIEPGRIFYPSSTESAAKRQCVQDCETTSEYDPVCGSDDITYINPGKFVCARNCGHNVFVIQKGRCPNEGPESGNVFSTTSPLHFSAL